MGGVDLGAESTKNAVLGGLVGRGPIRAHRIGHANRCTWVCTVCVWDFCQKRARYFAESINVNEQYMHIRVGYLYIYMHIGALCTSMTLLARVAWR